MSAYCQQLDGPVTLEEGKMVCHCPDCGPVELDDEDKQAWRLKPDWLTRKLRAALNLDGSQQAELAPGIVRLGLFDHRGRDRAQAHHPANLPGSSSAHRWDAVPSPGSSRPGRSRAWTPGAGP